MAEAADAGRRGARIGRVRQLHLLHVDGTLDQRGVCILHALRHGIAERDLVLRGDAEEIQRSGGGGAAPGNGDAGAGEARERARADAHHETPLPRDV